MEPGRRVFGRFEVTGPLPDFGELERHAAVEVETGRAVELVRPSALAALRPEARDRFRQAWDPTLSEHLPPARLPALALGEVDGRPAAIRPRVATTWPSGRRLDAASTRALASWLLPAITVAPPVGGSLTPLDVVLDESGRPWLAPSGIVPRPTVGSPPLYTPPDPTDSEADQARYGLGVLLFQAVSGELPFETTGNLGKLHERQRTPARVQQAAPETPDRLAQIIDNLVHPDAKRRGLVAIPPPIEPPLFAVQERAPRPPPATQAPPERAHPTGIRRDSPLAPFVVVLDNRTATDTSRRRLAALLDLPANAFVLPLGAPEEVLVASARTEAEANARMAELSAAGAPLSIVSTDTPPPARTAFLAGVASLLLLAPILAFLTGPVGGGVAAIAGLVALAMGWRISTAASSARDQLKQTGHYVERGPRAAPTLADGAHKLGTARLAQAARKAVLLQDLPDTVRVDLLDSIDDLERIGERAPEDVQSGLRDIARTAEQWSAHPLPDQDAIDRARRAVQAAQRTRT